MSDIKVTDKRMFTPDGELREEYRFLEQRPADRQGGDKVAAEAAAGEPAAATTPEPPPAAPDRPEAAGGERPPLELPRTGGPAPSFFDLVAMLAEPVALYLGDVELPDGSTGEDLEMARLHLGLLEVLREKTAMSLQGEESAFLEDVLYQLRMRYVAKHG